MTNLSGNGPQPSGRPSTPKPVRGAAAWWRRLLVGFWVVVLLVMHTMAGVLLWVALTDEQGFTGARQEPNGPGLFGVACVVVEVVAAVVTWGCVHEKVLRAWWYAVPALMIVTAVVRLTFISTPDTPPDYPGVRPGWGTPTSTFGPTPRGGGEIEIFPSPS
ncbi:hypothetical protein OG216_35710 [Streptomycetaceae bacterium NBC_01309]